MATTDIYPRPFGTIIGATYDPMRPPERQVVTTPSGATAVTGYPQGVSAPPVSPVSAITATPTAIPPRPPMDVTPQVERPAPDAWQQYNAAVRASAIAAGQRATNMTPEEEQQALSKQLNLTQDTTQRAAINARLGQVAQVIEAREAATQVMPEGYSPQQWQAMTVRDRAKAIQVAQQEKGRAERQMTGIAAQDSREAQRLGVRKEIASADREVKAATSQAGLDAAFERLVFASGIQMTKQQRDQVFQEKQLGARFALMADYARTMGDEKTELEMLRLGNDLRKAEYEGQVRKAVGEFGTIPTAPKVETPATGNRTAQATQGQPQATPTGGVASTVMPDVTGDGKPETQEQINAALRLVQVQPKPNPSWTPEQVRRWTDATIIAREYEKLRKVQASKMVGTENI